MLVSKFFTIILLLIPVSSATIAQTATTDSIYTTPDKAPRFGYGNFQPYLLAKKVYPKAALDSNIFGNVIVRFVIDKEGNTRNPSIIKSAHPLLDKAALLAVINMPAWIPGEKNGQVVNCYVDLNLPFAIESMPEFPGGQDALTEYLSQHKYPRDAWRKNIQGKVGVKFVIDEEGKVSDAKVVRPVYPSLDTEAVRIVMNMPKWKPAMQNGKKVKVYFTVPVAFWL